MGGMLVVAVADLPPPVRLAEPFASLPRVAIPMPVPVKTMVLGGLRERVMDPNSSPPCWEAAVAVRVLMTIAATVTTTREEPAVEPSGLLLLEASPLDPTEASTSAAVAVALAWRGMSLGPIAATQAAAVAAAVVEPFICRQRASTWRDFWLPMAAVAAALGE